VLASTLDKIALEIRHLQRTEVREAEEFFSVGQKGSSAMPHKMMMQLASAASCLRFHQIEPRLARWLLMTQDRAESNAFHITHEFLAYMLGVRRVGVTAAASVLQRDGLIKYHRGEIEVLNRRALEAAACSCYAADRDAYAKMLH
jgi:CRP-like cAMP-binding protein